MRPQTVIRGLGYCEKALQIITSNCLNHDNYIPGFVVFRNERNKNRICCFNAQHGGF